ncbi:Protein embryo sac development arrest 30 [Vitis vinifera]|uniref:O-fucosyltransferase family protein n=1 Tax=Vitis vinifera TaxID=29760 RepID=A0A438HGY3_VITVI|nr:Protein embryo sac development arrest 30 [Vitis vinifera]
MVKGSIWQGVGVGTWKVLVPNEKNNGFIYAKISGGFEKIRPWLLNATLVIPEIQQSTRSKGISYKFRSFSYLYNEEQFIASLKNDVIIVKSLPEKLKSGRRNNEFPTFRPKSSSSPSFYIKEILPNLKKFKVIGLILTDGGCLQVVQYSSMTNISESNIFF